MATFIFTMHILLFYQDDYPEVFTHYNDNLKAIIIFAPDNQSKYYKQSVSMLTMDPLGLDKRNIQIFEVFSEGGIGPRGESFTGIDVESIRDYYIIDAPDFYILLAHKKFEEIFRLDKPMVIDKIFQKFDESD